MPEAHALALVEPRHERRRTRALDPHISQITQRAAKYLKADRLSGDAWNSGAPLGLPLRHDRAVIGAAFSPDSARIVTASEDGTARIWDATTGLPLGLPLKHDKTVLGAVFSPDGTRIATASEDGTARIWDATTGLPLGLPFQHDSAVLCIAFSPDGARIVTASSDSTARVWEVAELGALSSYIKRATEWIAFSNQRRALRP